MIHPEELRIGNYIRDTAASDQFFAKVKKISRTRCHYGIFHSAYSDLKPIPLTEEILLRCGFDDSEYKDGYIGVEFQSNMILDFVLTKPQTMGEWQTNYAFEFSSHRFKQIEHLHQLQNLFFALTGKELELNTSNP